MRQNLSLAAICGVKSLESHGVCSSSNGDLDCSQKSSDNPMEDVEFTLVQRFHEALQDAYDANWNRRQIRHNDYISPACFLYLVDRFLILVTKCRGFFYTTKSSLVEWLISHQSEVLPTSCLAINRQYLDKFYRFIVVMVEEFIFNKFRTVEWISRSKYSDDASYKVLVFRVVVILCLLCVNSGKYYQVLFRVLGHVRNQLPKEFYGVVQQGLMRKYIQISEIGEAFQIAGDPLCFVSLVESVTRNYSNVISVQFGTNCSREAVMEMLFPARTGSSQAQTSTVPEVMNNPCDTVPCADHLESLTMPFLEVTPLSEQKLQINWALFQEISDLLKLIGSENNETSANTSIASQKVKEEIQASIKFLTAAITLPAVKTPCAGEDMIQEVHSMLVELKQLHSLLDTRCSEVASAERLLESLLLRKPKLEAFLNQCIVPKGDPEIVTPEKHCEEKDGSVCDNAEKIELPSATTESESVTPTKQCEEEGDAVFGEVEEMELPSVITESESSNQGAQSKQQKKGKGKAKGKGKPRQPKKGKGKKK